MNTRVADLDWSLVQTFLAVAEAGSLTQAAIQLGASQPTIGRRITQAETVLGVSLFTRVRHGLELTETGNELLQAAREIAARLTLTASGKALQPTGTVRIAASVLMSYEILPQIIAGLRQEEPGIHIELHASNFSDNLLFQEADIAVRMYRPKQDSVITRHIGDLKIGLFASKDYLERRGVPRSEQELFQHDWVGSDKSDVMLREMQDAGWTIDRSFFATRCDDHAAYWQLVKAGCGIGSGQICIAKRTPNIIQIMPDISILPLPIWLTAPEALRHTPRIRRVYDYLADNLPKETDMV